MSITTEEQLTVHAEAPIAESTMAQAAPHASAASTQDATPEPAVHEPTAHLDATEQAFSPQALKMEHELRRIQCEMTITNHVSASVGAGFIPIPVLDFAAVTGVQMDMVYRLCKIYGVDFSKEAARTAVLTLVGASVPGLQARFLSSGLKLIPGVGTIVGMFATPAVSGAATYAVGRVFVQHLETGGDLVNFDASKMKHQFERAFEKGKTMTSRTSSAKA